MSVSPGDTFLGDPRVSQSTVGHLWIVVEVYTPDLDTCVIAIMANATSGALDCDHCCVIERGDHPYISHQSFVYYREMVEIPVENLAHLKQLEPLSVDLLSRVRQGLHRSKFTPRGFKSKVPRQ